MATTTTNFGWDIPQSTDLVKDGATAIAALGQDIDTALVDLKGGTTNQVLSKASGTDLDFSWVTSSAGALTLITTQALSGVTSQSINSCFSATYANYLIVLNAYCATGAALPSLKLRVSGTDATSSYYSSFTARSWTDTLQSAASGNAGSWDTRPFGEMQASSSNPGGTSLTLFSPFAVTNTSYHSTYLNQSTSGSAGLSGGVHNSATSYDGFTITNAYAMTGTVRVYGLGI